MLEKLIGMIRSESLKSYNPEEFKIAINNAIKKIEEQDSSLKVIECITNLAHHIKENPSIVRCEDPNKVFAKLTTRFFVMYFLDENVLNIDKSIIFEITNAMNNVSYDSYQGVLKVLTNPTFSNPLVELNTNPLNYGTENVRIITNKMTEEYSLGKENNPDFLNNFMNNYANSRLHPEIEALERVNSIKSRMYNVIKNQDQLHPDWKPRFDAKKHLIEEINNMSGPNLKKFLEYDLFLQYGKCPDHHKTNDELVVVNITKCMNISGLECKEIDFLIDKVYALPLDQYSTALKNEIELYKERLNKSFFRIESSEQYLEDFIDEFEIENSKSK